MPTEREREYYRMGFSDGYESAELKGDRKSFRPDVERFVRKAEAKRKLSAWQKYIKNKRNHIKYRDGKLNLKKMGVEFRRKKRK
jgi:hypothetical protein